MRVGVFLLIAVAACAQPRAEGDAELIRRRTATEKALQEIAIVERKVMVPMRDGKRMAADIYRPKDESRRYGAIFVRTPYNFNYWDVRLRAPADMTTQLEAVKRGFAYVVMNERGHFFSEGNYDILGAPLTDGEDALSWIAAQKWSNGKVGAIGCSSTAEWQLAVAALNHPAFTTMVPQGFGAGVGRVRPWFEQGNWYRGGAFQMLFATWIYGQQNQVRPMFSKDATREDLVEAARLFDLAPQMPPVDWAKALWHLPVMDLLKSVRGPRGIYADAMDVDTGGRMIQRAPNDPAWYKGGLWHDDKPINIPGFWFMSWYDVSVGPNLAAYNYVRKTARPEVANQQYAIIAPVGHCAFTRATEDTIIGERPVGNARLNYRELTYDWFDFYLKGDKNGVLEKMPKVKYYTMGSNQWQSSDTWPPAGAQPMTLYLWSAGKANSLYGDGVLADAPPAQDEPDTFVYDPDNPVPSLGGNVCCTGNAITAGAFDQRRNEARADVLVYSTPPLKEGVEVSGSIEVTLYVSSDARDTDFTAKLVDVYPDGKAYNLDETIQRLRYREGYEKPPVWMEKGKVYKVAVGPMTTSNYFAAGHRIRIEISSSNFPRFDRNLNTGGNNYDESKPLIARNAVHHSKQYPSQVVLSVVRR
ncbi:MAG: CocE/NonD family hydrolase [Bryobacteraceae bacterium]|nr:CocE/NonD family hydrolase [Bryobacteraceae bacterium]